MKTATDLCACGCGGTPKVHKYTGGVAYVRCDTCGISTPYLPVERAEIRWNLAMGKIIEHIKEGDGDGND